MKRIMILGANGFLGTSIFSELQKDETNRITLFSRSKCAYNGDIAIEITDDLSNLAAYKSQLCEQDFIFYMAGLSGAALSNAKGPDFIISNEVYLLSLLDLIKNEKNPPAIIFPSSRLVYDSAPLPVDEHGQISPNSIYALCKLHSENLLSLYNKLYNIPYLVLRISIPFGFTNVLHNGYGIVNHFIQQSLHGRSIELFGKGDQRRDIIYIQDLKSIFGTCIEQFERIKNQVFNCGGTTIYSLADIAYQVVESLQAGAVVHVDWPEEYKRVETGDISLNSEKLYSALNFRPYFDLQMALSQIKSLL